METSIVCPRCGKEIDPDSQFCPFCGIAFPQNPDGSGDKEGKKPKGFARRKFSWLWILTFLGIMHVLDVGVTFVLGLGLDVPPRMVHQLPELVLVLISVILLLLAGFTTALLSPGKTLLEPAVGAAIYVFFSMLLDLDFTGIFLGWIAPLFVAWAGASLGEYVSARYQKKYENPGVGLQHKEQQPRQASSLAH